MKSVEKDAHAKERSSFNSTTRFRAMCPESANATWKHPESAGKERGKGIGIGRKGK